MWCCSHLSYGVFPSTSTGLRYKSLFNVLLSVRDVFMTSQLIWSNIYLHWSIPGIDANKQAWQRRKTCHQDITWEISLAVTDGWLHINTCTSTSGNVPCSVSEVTWRNVLTATCSHEKLYYISEGQKVATNLNLIYLWVEAGVNCRIWLWVCIALSSGRVD